ncbi:hypothetical protein SprV_0602110800 [Sparganum proliferum]
MFRRDREGRQGGGVLTYVKNGLNVSDKTDNFSCSPEAIWLSIKVPSSPSLDVLTVYRPPRRDNMDDARLLEAIEKFATRPYILIMGDFNALHIDWSSTHANSSEQTFDMSFLNTALKLFLNSMFADDIKIWRTIRSEIDEARLQTNLDHLEQWSKDWLLPFNVSKCNFLRVGRTSSPNHTVYRLTGKPLQEVDAQKDLGVWITTSLKPSLQCSKVANSAMSILYLVKRAFSSFDEDCFVKVFQTFVRPHLEFAIQAWRPWTAKDFGILEKVQRRATKLVSGQWSLPYETRLANLALFPLSYRQLRGDLIQAFRIVRNQGCCLASGDFFELATTTNLRGHPLKLRVTGARLDTRKFFFSNRVVAAWNALPGDVVMSGSVDTFKRRLDHHWSANHNNGSLPPP